MRLSVGIPVYNEQQVIPELLTRLTTSARRDPRWTARNRFSSTTEVPTGHERSSSMRHGATPGSGWSSCRGISGTRQLSARRSTTSPETRWC